MSTLEEALKGMAWTISEIARAIVQKGLAEQRSQMEKAIQAEEEIIRKNQENQAEIERKIKGRKEIEEQWSRIGLGEERTIEEEKKAMESLHARGQCFWVRRVSDIKPKKDAEYMEESELNLRSRS